VNCYDCEEQLERQKPAVGTCAHCGLGVCSEHSEVVRPVVRRFSGMTAARVGSDSRRLVCGECRRAERGAAASAYH
jgi:hypothetical protein